MNHAMLPGTHEWPRTPECVCGGAWNYWDGYCERRALAPCPHCQKVIVARAMRRHIKRMHVIDHDDGKENDPIGLVQG